MKVYLSSFNWYGRAKKEHMSAIRVYKKRRKLRR
jgi:hypothetical protein